MNNHHIIHATSSIRKQTRASQFFGLLLFCMAVVAQTAQGADLASESTEISRHGVTWTFDKPYPAGQFVTGDWWVVGPVKVVGITPAPRPASPEDITKIPKDQWGSPMLTDDRRMRNGSMVNPLGGSKQAYDSRANGYDPTLAVGVPLMLMPGQSLMSSASHQTMPNPNFFQGHREQSQSTLRAAAVLTCLDKAPPEDAFRPPYAGDAKPLYIASSLKRELLPSLAPAGEVPSYELYARYFERPWLDHMVGWTGRQIKPTENCPDYGREIGRMVSIASLMLLLDAPKDKVNKDKLLIGLIQLGIDLHAISKVGGNWDEGGGHSSGRKWPILFAGLMLNDEKMQTLPHAPLFNEDMQTYYGKGWTGAMALWQIIVHHAPREPYEHKQPKDWTQWDWVSEDYRRTCTSSAWIGTALAARYMKAVKPWGHDAFFDYCDRWMGENDTEAVNTLKALGHNYEANWASQGRTWEPFVNEMWKTYRASAPQQEMSGRNQMWRWEGAKGRWAENTKP